jgi:hypothetical protein
MSCLEMSKQTYNAGEVRYSHKLNLHNNGNVCSIIWLNSMRLDKQIGKVIVAHTGSMAE